jgi:hypothetical protein
MHFSSNQQPLLPFVDNLFVDDQLNDEKDH